MATQSTDIPGSGYGNTYLDSLIWGCGWTGIATPIRYWFGSGPVAEVDSSIGAFTGAIWSDPEKSAFEMAVEQYSAVCGLTFAEADDSAAADIVWWLAPESAMGAGSLGLHEVPDASWAPIYGYFNHEDSSWQYLDQGQYGYVTVIHELGHGMGLAHPHDGGDEADATKFSGVRSAFGSYGTNGLNQGIWTTMSYNDGWSLQRAYSDAYGWQGSLMAFDIAALQALYGANATTETGDNEYELPDTLAAGTFWSCIWDAGGSDTISNEGSNAACTINLNAAPLTGANAAGFVSWVRGVPGGFTIANGVTIENASGGNAADVLVGNAAGNILDGGPGADTMSGGAGNDSYHVDNLRDKVIEGANGGTDTVLSAVSLTLAVNVENLSLLDAAGAARATGNALNNLLTGNASANALSGGTGNDTLNGGGGADTLAGGRGADTFVFAALSDLGVGTGLRDVVTDFKALQGDRIDLSAIDAVTGSPGNDVFAFIGAAAFSGAAGQLRFDAGILAGDVTGDGVADFEIQLAGVRSFDALALIA